MLERVERFIIKRLCSRPGPLSYIVMLASWFTGLLFAFFSWNSAVKDTVIYRNHVLGSPVLWGITLLIGSTMVIVGLLKKRNYLVKYGAMANSVMWWFAGILYAEHSYWYAFGAAGLLHIAIQAHFYLSAAFDTLFPKR